MYNEASEKGLKDKRNSAQEQIRQYGNLFFSVKNEMNKIHKKSKE
jgi:hypothetical protein